MAINSYKHSFPSRHVTHSDEEAAALDMLKADLCAEHQPANTTEEMLVNEMAEQFWRLRRARALEARLLDGDGFIIPHVDAVQRMIASAERGFHRALTALRQLQKDRGSRSESASAPGFVPANSASAPAQRTESPKRAEPLPSRDRQGAAAVGFVSQNPKPALQRSA